MDAPNQSNPRATQKPKSSSGILWLLIAVAVVGIFLMRSRRAREPEPSLLGQPLPPLHVAGWLNVDGPLREDLLRGEVVLVDFWASWCVPCRAKMPKLVEYRRQYGEQGVVFLGLTPESADELDSVQTYVESVDGLDWPIGYGAHLPIDMLGIEAYPTLVLFDKLGNSVWAGHGFKGLDEALVKALAEDIPSDQVSRLGAR